jgi:hypothetical protein
MNPFQSPTEINPFAPMGLPKEETVIIIVQQPPPPPPPTDTIICICIESAFCCVATALAKLACSCCTWGRPRISILL